MRRICFAIVLEQMLFEPFERHSHQESGGHDAIRVDVMAAQGQAAAFELEDPLSIET